MAFFNAKRLVLYTGIALFAAVFTDTLSFILTFCPLALIIELSFAAILFFNLLIKHSWPSQAHALGDYTWVSVAPTPGWLHNPTGPQ